MSGTVVVSIPKTGKIEVPNPPPISPLEFIKQIVENVNAQLASIDSELQLASNGDAGQIKDLSQTIHEIKSKSEAAISAIDGIHADPRLVELSGNRINSSSKTYSDINGLITVVNTLEQELYNAEFDYYRTVADLLIEAQHQLEYFQPYFAIPHVAIIRQKVSAIESELRRQIQWAFREIGLLTSSDKYDHENDPSDPGVNVDVSALAQVYLVVDALGDRFRKDLLERFSQLQLLPYEKLFQTGAKYAGLQFLDQRYAWFEHLLQIVDEKMSTVVPTRWNVPFHLFEEFARRTNKHLTDVLSHDYSDPNNNSDVAILVRSITSLNNFEKKMLTKFTDKLREDSENPNQEIVLVLDTSMREAFDVYLGPYIQIEKKGLHEVLGNITQGEQTPVPPRPGDPTPEVPSPPFNPGEPYPSSTQLVENIKSSLKRVLGFSNGSALFMLSKEHAGLLLKYAEILKARCPPPETPVKPDKPPQYRINKTDEKTLCRIICTAEYCIDTIPGLENVFKQKIRDDYKDKVDFNSLCEVFHDLVAFAMNILASGEINRMKDMFEQMRAINWATDIVVGDVNDHAKQMLKVFVDCIPRIRNTMSGAYFQNFCNKIITVFLDQYLATVWKLRRVSKTGGAQLLMDLNGVKEFLVKMPNVKLPEGKDAVQLGKAYFKFLDLKLGRVENILKLVIAEDASIDEMFEQLLPDATPKEKDNILILKGLKLAVPVPIKDFGDKVKASSEDTASKIKVGAEETMRNVKSSFNVMGGNIRNAFGDILSGNMFQEGSDLGTGSSHSNHGQKRDSKSAASGITAAMSFNKKPATAPGTTPVKR
jgi:hypothetical protein